MTYVTGAQRFLGSLARKPPVHRQSTCGSRRWASRTINPHCWQRRGGGWVTKLTHHLKAADTHPCGIAFARSMEKIMSLRELRDDELENVSGGLDASKNEVAVEGTVRVTKFKIEPTSFEFGLTHWNE